MLLQGNNHHQQRYYHYQQHIRQIFQIYYVSYLLTYPGNTVLLQVISWGNTKTSRSSTPEIYTAIKDQYLTLYHTRCCLL